MFNITECFHHNLYLFCNSPLKVSSNPKPEELAATPVSRLPPLSRLGSLSARPPLRSPGRKWLVVVVGVVVVIVSVIIIILTRSSPWPWPPWRPQPQQPWPSAAARGVGHPSPSHDGGGDYDHGECQDGVKNDVWRH